MKELQNLVTDKLEIQNVKPIKKETKIVDKIIPGDGHKIYALDLTTGKVSVVEVKQNVDINGKKQNVRLDAKEKTVYCSALNRKNAERKFLNWAKKISNK